MISKSPRMSWNLLSFEPELVIERLLSREAAGREQRCPPPPLQGATGTRVATLPQPRLPQEETRCPYLMEAVECSETVLKKKERKINKTLVSMMQKNLSQTRESCDFSIFKGKHCAENPSLHL